MREYAISSKTAIVLYTGTASRQLWVRTESDPDHILPEHRTMIIDRLCKRTYPVCSAEIDSFSKVIPLIEATVVGSGEGDDKLTSTLVGADNLPDRNAEVTNTFFRSHIFVVYVHLCETHRYTMGHQNIGVHDGDQLV